MEPPVRYCQTIEYAKIEKSLYDRLKLIGIIPDEVRRTNVGKSNYSDKVIQPWSIWKDYNLNPWDADIVKRVLRTKREYGLSETESRIMDYEKIIHICQERLRQLRCEPEYTYITIGSHFPDIEMLDIDPKALCMD
jgi:hypothetical protein